MQHNPIVTRLIVSAFAVPGFVVMAACPVHAGKITRKEAYRQCKAEHPEMLSKQMMVVCVQRKMRQ